MSREVATYGSGHIDCDARKAANKKLRNHLFSNYGASFENRTSADPTVNNPSDAAGVEHIIDAFLLASDYELRFGPHS